MPLDNIDGIYTINLKRRPDRLQSFFERSGLARSDVHVHEGVDGQLFTEWTDDLEFLFGNLRFVLFKGEYGAALSHFSLWQHIASTENQHHLILEDDCHFVKHWVKKWNDVYAPEMPRGAHVVFLGGFLHIHDDPALYDLPVVGPYHQYIKAMKKDMIFPPANGHTYMFSGLSYVLSSDAAKALVRYISEYGIQLPIDHYLIYMKVAPYTTFATIAPLVELPPIRESTVLGADSDVQGNKVLIKDGVGTETYYCKWKKVCNVTIVPKDNVERVVLLDNIASTALGNMRTILVSAIGVPSTFRPDAEKRLRKANLPFSRFATVDANNMPIAGLKTAKLLTETYNGTSRQAALHLSLLVVFETLMNIHEHRYLVLEESVAVKHYFLEALATLATVIPPDFDILFLDCPAACNTADVFLGLTLVDERCPRPGGHAVIVSDPGARKIASSVLPLSSSWDASIYRHAHIASYCAWPHLAEQVVQWQLWREFG